MMDPYLSTQDETKSEAALELPEDTVPRVREQHCNVLSMLFFCWIDLMIWQGCWRPLTEDKLIHCPSDIDSERLLNRFDKYWERNKASQRRLSITLFRCLWHRVLLNGLLVSVEKAMLIADCILLGYFTEYFTNSNPSSEETRSTYLNALGLILIAMALTMLYAHGSLIAQKTGLIARVMVTGAIYTKILKSSHLNGVSLSTGQAIGLISNDVNKLDQAFIFLHYLWIGPLYIAVYTYLVYQEIGASAFIALGFALLQIPLQMFLAQTFSKWKFKLAETTERRAKLIAESIIGMRLIKMCALEDAFFKTIMTFRRREFQKILKTSLIRVTSFSIFTITLAVIVFLLFSVYTAYGGTLTPKKVFTILSLTASLRVTSIHFFILGLLNLAECRVAINRIQDFLTDSTHRECLISIDSSQPTVTNKEDVNSLRMTNVFASWTGTSGDFVLKNVTMEVNQDFPLLMLVGPVAAGKTSLIQCLLGEIKPIEGIVEINGKISYASQEPWVFSGTLRENILFGNPFNKEWYNTVVEACALDKDIAQFNDGDMALIGDNGVSLSGGQRARVNLARAVYHKADVYLLDDPLSAVDTAVARQIFEKCIHSVLNKKLIVLATSQLQFVHRASKILAIKEGSVVAFCRPCDLQSKGIHPTRLVTSKCDDQFKACWDEDGKKVSPDTLQERQLLSPVFKRPSIFDGISFYSAYSRQPSLFDTTSIYSHTSNSLVSAIKDIFNVRNQKYFQSVIGAAFQSNTEHGESNKHTDLNVLTYAKYFQHGGCWLILVALMTMLLLGEASVIIGDIWISKWAQCFLKSNITNESLNFVCDLSVNQRISYLGLIASTSVILNVARIAMIHYVALNASHVLHNKMLSSIMHASIRFFDATPFGNVANCFSKDINTLDEVLPFMLCEYLMLIFRCLAVIITTVVVNTYTVGPAIVFVIALLCLRWYYLRTSRQIKSLESVACHPILSHAASTIKGLLSIRTFKKEAVILRYYHQFSNQHSRMWYLCIAGTRWFGMRIDFLIAMFIAICTCTSVYLATAIQNDAIGLGIAYVITLTGTLQYCIRLSGETESAMLSAERVMQYGELPPEKNSSNVTQHENITTDWPQHGEIELYNVSLYYTPETPLVLKSLTCHIHPGEKIGIVGRTGAGKSSFAALLLEVAVRSGTITIGGIDISQVDKRTLRKHISFVPQQPLLFCGTLKYNLDPFEKCTDDEVWKSLEHVQLKPIVQNMDAGLYTMVSEGGSNFSVGQRQLICLARALLRKNKILVLDEVTANVDPKTDKIIQQVIRENFIECTMIIIAHHLNTIIDCNRVLVLDNGRIKEFDHAYVLLQNPNSLFKKMMAQLGSSAAATLQNMARESFSQRLPTISTRAHALHIPEIRITELEEGDQTTTF